MSTPPPPVNVNDVQGDVILGLPKRSEDFIFFQVTNVTEFKKRLHILIPLITTTAQVQAYQQRIADHKKSGAGGLLTLPGVNIAFTFPGLNKLGVTGAIGDASFEAGMLAGAQGLGDTGTLSSDGKTFTPNWLDPFKGQIDGVILITGDSAATVAITTAAVQAILIGTIKTVLNVQGNVRPGDQKGHEHFGFLDGVSLPAIASLTPPKPGQLVVAPSNLILGSIPAAPWANNGSFLVYRHFNQLVPEFHQFLLDNALSKNTAGTTLSKQDGANLLGARFFGRWASGAPVDVSPNVDDPVLAKDDQKNNDFDFSDAKDQSRCPFAAHIRKTNPRSDLPPGAVAPHAINRTSIPFGPELTAAEKAANKTIETRGLAFVCYSSTVVNGFQFLQNAWVDTTTFPPKSPVVPGFDPIIGQNKGNNPRTLVGTDPNNQGATLTLPVEWVIAKGGAYFFSPAISALKGAFSSA